MEQRPCLPLGCAPEAMQPLTVFIGSDLSTEAVVA